MTHAIVRHSPYLVLFLGFACSLLIGVETDFVALVSGNQPRGRRLEFDELVALSGLFTFALALLAVFNSRMARHERRKRAEAERHANLDALTGMANRRLFFDRLKAAFERSRNGHPCAVVLVDLDGFKMVNDTYGHAAGDLVLTKVASRIEQVKSAGSLASRLGGDEFALVIEGPDAAELQVRALAKRLGAVIAEPIDCGGHCLTVGSSVGLAFWSADFATPTAMLEAADGAMYRAKRKNRDNLAA